MEATQIVRPGYQTVAIATVELVEKIHQLFPEAVVKPSEPYEDEDICLTIYGLWEGEELQLVRNKVYELEFEIYDKYEVEAMAKVLPLSYLPKSEPLRE
jgi:hypothetical protein